MEVSEELYALATLHPGQNPGTHSYSGGEQERENSDLTWEFNCQLRIIRDRENRDIPFNSPREEIHWSQAKTVDCHSLGDDCDIWSDLCAHFSALRMKHSPLQKIKLWPCKEYQAFAPHGSVAMLSYHIHYDLVSRLSVCTLCMPWNQKGQKVYHRLCIKSLDKQQEEHWDVNFFAPFASVPSIFFSSFILQSWF
jgi:hypothetical protein